MNIRIVGAVVLIVTPSLVFGQSVDSKTALGSNLTGEWGASEQQARARAEERGRLVLKISVADRKSERVARAYLEHPVWGPLIENEFEVFLGRKHRSHCLRFMATWSARRRANVEDCNLVHMKEPQAYLLPVLLRGWSDG